MSDATDVSLAELQRTVETLRRDFETVLPHVVAALKRDQASEELARRLRAAEEELAFQRQWATTAAVHRVLVRVRRLEFDAEVRSSVVTELEQVLAGAGLEEFGAAGDRLDPSCHEPARSTGDAGSAVVDEVLVPGLRHAGRVVSRAKVTVVRDGSEGAPG